MTNEPINLTDDDKQAIDHLGKVLEDTAKEIAAKNYTMAVLQLMLNEMLITPLISKIMENNKDKYNK